MSKAAAFWYGCSMGKNCGYNQQYNPQPEKHLL